MFFKRKTYLLLLLLAFIIGACQSSKKETAKKAAASQLGELSLQVTGKESAQPHFKKGLLLLYSFEYEDAREAFLKAQEEDADFAMAYWGEAMTYHHSLWQRQEKEKSVGALQKLADTKEERLSKVETTLEKDLFKGAEILFGEGTKYERDVAYRDYMEGLQAQYPNNHEVAALYAISLLGSSRNGRDGELYDKSARIAQGIIKENPNHPGALHYLIHSYDDPVHAHLAKNAADSYSKVAPDAAHALHMPSHIYVALGKWEDVITSNIASWNASVKKAKKQGKKKGSGSYHAFNWLQYGLLQKGEVEQAEGILKDMVKYGENNPTKRAMAYLVAMKGGYMVETNTWSGELADIPLDIDGLNITKKGGFYFIEGMKAYHQKETNDLTNIIKDLEESRLKAQNLVGEEGFAMCSAVGLANKPPNQLDIDMVEVMEMELRGYLADLNKNKQEAKKWFQKASELDETLNYSFGPPTILKPAHEAYAEWLLENTETEAALAMFDKSLKRHPKRLLSLKGKKQAAELLGNAKVVKAVEEELAISLNTNARVAVL